MKEKGIILLKKRVTTKKEEKWWMIMKKAMEEVNNEQKEIYVCFIKLAIFIKITYLRTFARKFSNIDFFF